MRRTQIYLDETQAERLGRRARASGTTMSDLIRDAIDRYLTQDDDETQLRAFQAAVRSAVGVAPDLPEGSRYVEALRRGDLARERDLAERRRR